MDWLQFIASVIGSLAWPAAAVILGFMFREQVRKLLDKMKSLKAPGGIEAAFEQEARELIVQATTRSATRPATPEEVAQKHEAQKENLERLLTMKDLKPSEWISPDEDWLEVNPRLDRPSSAILRCWFALEELMGGIIREANVPRVGAPEGGYGYYAHSLYAADIIDKQTADTLKRMRSLRDQLIHSELEPSREAAVDYYVATRKLIAILQPIYEDIERLKQ
jgi:hypothetical protein